MYGFLNINKAPGPTSHDIVAQVRRRIGRDVKVGHAGTLDPFAQGVLIICLGGACRLASLIVGQPKRYVTTIQLGAASDTDDLTGNVTPLEGAQDPGVDRVREVLGTFVGEIQQVPPSHSAIFVQGRRAYKIARKGGELDLPPRAVRVDSVELLEYRWPNLRIDVACGSGTYIRAMARDIGNALQVGGHCVELIRTAVGAFTLDGAVDAADLDYRRNLVSPLVAVGHIPNIQLSAQQATVALLGRSVALSQPCTPGEAAIIDPNGMLLALGHVTENGHVLKPDKVPVAGGTAF